jgi:MerR family transcriptional regulator, light-induced transcriptional regulator
MTALRSTYEAYVRALRAGDRHGAFRVITAARDAGHDIEALYLEVLQAALREVGRLWQLNEMTVAQEHLATVITQGAMARLYEDIFQRYEGAGDPRPLLIGACAPRERHEIGLRMLCDLLELDGWDTLYLGASVPDEALVAMILDRKPNVLALSASTAPQVVDVETTIRAVRAHVPEPPHIMVGGRAFLDDAGLAERIGADAAARDAREAVRMLARHAGRS